MKKETPLWAKTWNEVALQERSNQMSPWVSEWNEKRRIEKEQKENEKQQKALALKEQYGGTNTGIALARFGALYLLIGTERGKKIVDGAQEKILDYVDNTLNKFGIQGQSLLPTTKVIGNQLNKINESYLSLLPKGALSSIQTDTKIDEETRSLVTAVVNGKLDKEYHTTDDERKIAKEIIASMGSKTPKELNQILKGHVFGRAADIANARITNRNVQYHQQLSTGLHHLEKQKKPKTWIVADWVLTEIGMNKAEQRQMEQTVWGVSPFGLTIMSLSNLEDIVDIPWQFIGNENGNDKNIQVQQKYLDWVEHLRSKGDRIISRPIIERLREGLGGIVNLTYYGRKEPVAEFAVRDSKSTANKLIDTGNLSQEYHNLLDRMTSAIRNPEAGYSYLIRPSHVIEQLPDPLTMELPVRARTDGTLDWNPALDSVSYIKQRIESSLRKRILQTASRLDDTGKPSKIDKEAINYLGKAIESANGKIERVLRLRAENDSIMCPYCQTAYQGHNCHNCGANHPSLNK